MKKVTTAIIAYLFTLSTAHAATTFGGADCGQWLSRKSPIPEAWLNGFLTGLNLSGVFTGDPLDKVNSADQIYAWMDNYCRKNPLKRIANGGVELLFELEKK